jgi:Flp pilus assembly protein TadD
MQPDSVVAYMNRSSALLKKGEVKRAIHDAKHALELSPRETSAFQILATAYLLERNAADGLAVAAKGLEIAPFDAELHLKKGVALHLQGDFACACDEFEHAARHAPGDPGPFAALAWLEATCPDEEFRDGRHAIELATVACRLSDWKHPRHLAVLAAAYAEAGMFSAAIERAVQAASLAGDDAKLEQEIRKLLAAFRADRPYRSNVPWLLILSSAGRCENL